MFLRLAFLSLLLLPITGTTADRHPLEPADTSSPRATFESFLALTEEAARRYFKFRDSPSAATQKALWEVSHKATRLFDLSQVAPANRLKVADETFYLLWDVIARLQIPDVVEIPDFSEIPAAAAEEDSDEKPKQPTDWRIPDTEITIAQVVDGPRAGEFLFDPDTVRRARLFYEATRERPYLRPIPIANVYRVNQLVTGWMIPLTWVEALPGWANTQVLGQVLWKWFALVLLFAFALGTVIAVHRWGRRKPWDGSLRAYLRYISAPLAILALAPLLRFFAWQQINVTGAATEAPAYLTEVAEGLAVVWLIWLTASGIAETIIAQAPRVNAKSLDANLIRLAARSVGFAAALVLFFQVAHAVGIPVYGLVAGAGVGGLAVALAARSTLENFIGTLNLYADRPVRVGDFCRYGEDPNPGWLRIGTVEEIGLRSTRLRGIDRTVTSIPNADFSNMHIVNLTKRDRMIFRTNIGLRYETSPDQLRGVLAALREMLLAHPRITEQPARVRAAGFGDHSVNLEIFAYVNTSDWEDFLAVQEDLVLRIIEIVQENGTAFAFPSRTVYHARDPGLDSERQQAAEKQVKEWAAAHALPFPDFPPDYRLQILNTLDYPPEGSPGADRG